MKYREKIEHNGNMYSYCSLSSLQDSNVNKLPVSLKILLENLLRHYDDKNVTQEDIKALINRHKRSIYYHPARVLMQDFTGVPALVDLASMRDAAHKRGISCEKINPLIPVDLVIDHSVQVDAFGSSNSFLKNETLEMSRNSERYEFLKWGQKAFNNFRVVPPGMGICHQVNLEYLAKVMQVARTENEILLYPDTVVGTDSHTTMINGLSVLGWGVGGIEAEAVMLGQPISMLIPEVFGVKLTGELREGITATDLVLYITHVLRKQGVVGKFVEFYGSGLTSLPLSNRATIANMAPEYGATCGFFPIDEQTIEYLHLTGRDNIDLIKIYAQKQGLWHDPDNEPIFADGIEINLTEIMPTLAGPKRPQDNTTLDNVMKTFTDNFPEAQLSNHHNTFQDGSVVIAAITSCTNTSNPSVMIAAGLLARNALKYNLKVKPWVKTSLAPGSKVVTEYLEKSGLQTALDQLGFNLVGYGCTTCIGNSGPLTEEITKEIQKNQLTVTSVLSGNRNFEGRINPLVKANYLASPPLVVAYALVGSISINLKEDVIGYDEVTGKSIYLKDIWPSNKEIQEIINSNINAEVFAAKYKNIFEGNTAWQQLKSIDGALYNWQEHSTYVQRPPFFENLSNERSVNKVVGANILAILGDSITTDHISPAGSIAGSSPAGQYLQKLGVSISGFNSYGARRGNHQVMMRGTFANIRIRNRMLDDIEGGFTRHIPSDSIMPIYDAAMLYKEKDTPLVVIAGEEYGTGSSRDWAAKGTALLGVKAIIAESFERIHRSNLVGMGVLPLLFQDDINSHTLKLDGTEIIDLDFENISPKAIVQCRITKKEQQQTINLLCAIDTDDELQYFKCGGILQFFLLSM